MDNLGKNINILRISKKWTQKELADKLGVSDKAVSKWENGNGLPDIVFLPKLAEVFGVSMDALCGGVIEVQKLPDAAPLTKKEKMLLLFKNYRRFLIPSIISLLVILLIIVSVLVTYTAVKDNDLKNPPAPPVEVSKTYKVTYIGYNNSVIGTKDFPIGSEPEMPILGDTIITDSVIFTFNCWIETSTNVYKASYTETPNLCSVTYLGFYHEIIYNETVKYGEASICGMLPAPRETDTMYRYEFVRWSEDTSYVKDNMFVYPVFNKFLNFFTFTVDFDNGKENHVFTIYDTIQWLIDINASQITDKIGKENYQFIKWQLDGRDLVDSDYYDKSAGIIQATATQDHILKAIYRYLIIDIGSFRLIELKDGTYGILKYLISPDYNDHDITINLGNTSYYGKTISVIYENAFNNANSVVAVKIFSDIKKVEKNAFLNCNYIEDIFIYSDNTVIEEGAFNGCSGTKSTYLNVDNLSIITLGKLFGQKPFNGATEVVQGEGSANEATYYIPASLTSVTLCGTIVPAYFFENMKNLTAVLLPDYRLEAIAYHAFRNCSSLTSILIPPAVSLIGMQAFEGCTSLNEIHMQAKPQPGISNNTKDGIPVIYGYNNITSHELFDYCLVENYAYITAYKGNGGHVEIPAKLDEHYVISFGRVFRNNTSITSVNLNSDSLIDTIPYAAFDKCTSLESFTFFPYRITSVGDYAFNGCTSLKEFKFQSRLKRIGDRAFYDCTSLSSPLIFPNSLTQIGNYAFYNATRISYILVTPTIAVGNYAFANCDGYLYCTWNYLDKSNILSYYGWADGYKGKILYGYGG